METKPMTPNPSTTRSRRAILAAAAGAAAATVVGAVTKPGVVRAAGDDGSIMHIGDFYADARSQTTWANQANDNIVLWVASNPDSGGGGGLAVAGYSHHGIGVQGQNGTSGPGVKGLSDSGPGVDGSSASGAGVSGSSTSSYGVSATSASSHAVHAVSTSNIGVWAQGDNYGVHAQATGTGVYGQSSSSIGVSGSSASSYGVFGGSTSGSGVYGISEATNLAATVGVSYADSTGVQGFTGPGSPPAAKPKTGVYGYANQDSTAKGVVGESSKGYAGFFLGKVYTSKWHEMTEISTPTAPSSSRARIFLKDNGAGRTQLCVRFHSGAVQVLATQP
jgi:hypothetical protein